MGVSLLQAVAALMSTCTRRLQRAARRMGGGGGRAAASLAVVPWRKAFSLPSSSGKEGKRGGEEGGVWRKEILLGERCQPLEFSGVIHYDADGGLRQPRAPPPRSPIRSPLPASVKLSANSGVH